MSTNGNYKEQYVLMRKVLLQIYSLLKDKEIGGTGLTLCEYTYLHGIEQVLPEKDKQAINARYVQSEKAG